jgi:signal transduction histidine kinase
VKASLVYELGGQVIEDELKLNIYRIIQEQINNILKHAEASEVTIMINGTPEQIHVSIADNGKGFDIAQPRMGIGITNMINRVDSFNGEVVIESSIGKGCRVDVNIPL